MRSPADELSKEAVRVVGTMPKWKPGKQRGKPVRVKYVLPVVFRLN
jgi:protein TonB